MNSELFTGNRHLPPPPFELVAGSLCLDFVNTLDDRFSAQRKELLKSYIDVLRFCKDAASLPDREIQLLIGRNHLRPDEGERALASAIRMREAMYAVFWPIAQKKPIQQAAIRTLNEYVQEASGRMILMPGKGRFVWGFKSGPDDINLPLWPIARSAADLLASDQLQFVRACASKTCEWLFLDTSKSHRRRWCDMTKCGNRAKVKTFYTRNKKSSN